MGDLITEPVVSVIVGVVVGGLLQWWGTSRESEKLRRHEKEESALARREQIKAGQRQAAQEGTGLLWQEYERIDNSVYSEVSADTETPVTRIGLCDMAMCHVMLPSELSDLFDVARTDLSTLQHGIVVLKFKCGIDVAEYQRDRERELYRRASFVANHDEFKELREKTADAIREYDKAAARFIGSGQAEV